jgi:Uma2 family endonuclease
MVAAPIEIDESGDSVWRPPYTVDTLFELPETELRFEVLEGSLIVSPPPTTAHNSIYAELFAVFLSALPRSVRILPNTAVRLPNGDGPIPDLLVGTAANAADYPKGLPAAQVRTVIEVVSPSNAVTDRVTKTRLYAEAGIPCYWRIEQRPWKEHLGPCPAIVVRLRDEDGEWHQTTAPAGAEAELPVIVDTEGTIVTVKLDPATLTR